MDLTVTWSDVVGSILWIGLMAGLVVLLFVVAAGFIIRRNPEFRGTSPEREGDEPEPPRKERP